MQSKQSAINTLMQLGTRAKESALNYSQLSLVNNNYVQSLKRPLNLELDNRVLQDLAESDKACQDDLETFINAYIEIYKRLFGDELENNVLRKNALEFYDGAMRSTDFDTVFMVKVITGLREADNYRFILMGMAWDIDYFNSDLKLMSKGGKNIEVMSILLMMMGFTLAVLSILPDIGVTLGVTLGFTIAFLGASLFIVGDCLSKNKIPSSCLVNETSKNTITGRYGYFARIEQINPELKEILASDDEEVALSDPETSNAFIVN